MLRTKHPNIMKKTILLLAALILLTVITNAQDKGATSTTGKAFDENSHVLNIGVGFGHNYYSYTKYTGYYYRNIPTISISYEQPYKKRLGPGFLGVGGYFAFRSTSYGYDDVYWGNEKYYYRHTYNNFLGAARAAYHWDGLNAKNAEVYGGVLLGFRAQTYNYTTNNNDPDFNDDYKIESGFRMYPVAALFVGARWYFAKNLGVYSELGSGISYITFGLSFKW